MRVKLIFAWYDAWVGAFWDRVKKRLYIFPVPCVGLQVDVQDDPPLHGICGDCGRMTTLQQIPRNRRRYECLDCAWFSEPIEQSKGTEMTDRIARAALTKEAKHG